MIPSKILTLCLVGFVLLADFIDARPAPDESDGKDKLKHVVHHVHKEGEGPGEHVHRIGGGSGVHHFKVGGGGGSGGGGGGGGTHVHHIEEGGGGGGGGGGGSGGTHVHHIEEGGGGGGGSGGTHVHHFSTGGSGGGGAGGIGGGGAGGGGAGGGGAGGGGAGGGGAGGGGAGGSGGNLNIDADGSGLGGLNIKGFSPDTIKKFKKLLSDNNIDLSKLDLGNLNLGGSGGGAAGGAVGGGGIHKYDGKDSLQPAMCDDSINDRYGVGKHFVRGTRDVGFAIVSEAEAILDPLLGFITHGVGQGLKALLCAIEDGFSDFGSDFDSATDIAKHGLVNFFKLQGPHPVLGIPIGIGGIAGEAVKAAVSIAGDAVGGIGNAVNEIITNLG